MSRKDCIPCPPVSPFEAQIAKLLPSGVLCNTAKLKVKLKNSQTTEKQGLQA